jgi:hypothetical protein
LTSKKTSCIIGLDISTSCTGVSVLDLSGNVIKLSYHKPSGDTLVEKANDLKAFLSTFVDEACNEYNLSVNDIYIEQNLQKFRRGFSSAQVINTLARFNGMISYIAFETFKIQPVYVNVNEGRKALGIKIPRGSNTKEWIFQWCQEKYPKIIWPTKKLKSGPRKGLVIFDSCCYDMSDALITASAGLKIYEKL